MTHHGTWLGTERPHHWPFQTVLITGYRHWDNTALIRAALAWVWHPTTLLRHGACPTGADRLAEDCWKAWGGHTDPLPADWARHGTRAGPIRNRAMVALGADITIAFLHPESTGTWGCARLAHAAGIPTYVIHHPEETPCATTA